MKPLVCLLVAFFFSVKIFAQITVKDSCTAFTLAIEGENLISDSILLTYPDCDKTKSKDTLILLHGKAVVAGKINRATEAILFTNMKSMWMDGPGTIRFIMEPGNMTLHFVIKNDTACNIIITGSPSQDQKLAWMKENSSNLFQLDKTENENMQLLRALKTTDSIKIKERLKEVWNQIDVLRQSLVISVLKYVKEHPDSYLSGYLLYHYYKRNISTDTLEKYFAYLTPRVIQSDFGKFVLEDLLKQTDNLAFRKKFSDSAYFAKLESIHSIYDVALPDTEGTRKSLSDFRGKLLLIDFWASWCGPCIKNVPYLKELEAAMKGKPFSIISVSVDKDKNDWKRSVKKHQFPGVDLWDEKEYLSTFYKVIGIPQYVLLNADGSVADIDAPQAIAPELKLEIEKLLKKNKLKNAD